MEANSLIQIQYAISTIFMVILNINYNLQGGNLSRNILCHYVISDMIIYGRMCLRSEYSSINLCDFYLLMIKKTFDQIGS